MNNYYSSYSNKAREINDYLTKHYQKYLVCHDDSVLEVSPLKEPKLEFSKRYRQMIREVKADKRVLFGKAPQRRKQDRSFRFERHEDRAFKRLDWKPEAVACETNDLCHNLPCPDCPTLVASAKRWHMQEKIGEYLMCSPLVAMMAAKYGVDSPALLPNEELAVLGVNITEGK